MKPLIQNSLKAIALMLSLFGSLLPNNVFADPISIISINQTQEICNLGNGTLTINATGGAGPLIYSVNGGLNFQSSNFFDGLESGDYLIIVSDGISCTEVETVQIADAPEPELSFSFQCVPGLNQANIDLMPFDGISPYTFLWLGPNGSSYSTEDLNLIEPGAYFITVTDALGCQVDSSLIISTCCELNYLCGLQDTVLLECISLIPPINSVFLDLVSNNDEDRIAFESLGSMISSSCNDVVVTAVDSPNNPTDCISENYIVVRRYTVDDGVSMFNCERHYIVDHYEALSIHQDAQDMTVQCSVDINVEFNTWINTIGGALYSICSEPLTVTTAPAVPALIYSCPGTASAEVTFFLRDNCGNLDSTFGIFSIVDLEAPIVNCPADLSVQYDDPQYETIIGNWLSQAIATDNCLNVELTNDFDIQLIEDECEIVLPVIFTGIDECFNSATCSSTLTIENNVNPTITCPGSISIECGSSTNAQLIDAWLSSATAVSQNNVPLDLIWNYEPTVLPDLTCGDVVDVLFQVEDDCQRNNQCVSSIIVTDNTAPEIHCPSILNIDNTVTNAVDLLTEWLALARGTDNCTAVNLGNDFDFNILDDLCQLEGLEILFIATDECSNTSSCISGLQVNSAGPSIICPLPISLECGSPTFQNNIDNWLSLAGGEDNTGQMLNVTDDYNESNLLIGCGEVNTILFSVADRCNQTASCESQLIIMDTQAPELQCPEDITVELLDPDYNSQIELWINSFSSMDACHNVLESSYLPEDILDIICNKVVEVEFVSVDECGNESNCFADLSLINHNVITLTCPEPIEFECSHPQLSLLISSYLEEIQYTSELPVSITDNFNSDLINTDCVEEQTISIQIDVFDECFNLSNCQVDIKLIPDPRVYIPNIFSPGSDGLNDYFTLFGNSSVVEIINMTIYNRWGEKIFEKNNFSPNDAALGWDGYYKNRLESLNVYAYQITIRDYFNKEISFTGSLQLVR